MGKWHVVNSSIDMSKVRRFPRSKTIGVPSVNGTVRPLIYGGNKFLLVSKEMPVSKRKSFEREVKVGTMRGIGRIAPKVYAWRRTGDRYEYIMDNLAGGDPRAKVTTLSKYRGKKPLRKLYEVLKTFYRITGGFHGDLHQNNIAVITHGARVEVKLYDFGTWRPFPRGEVSRNANKIFDFFRAQRKLQPGNKWYNRKHGVIDPKNQKNQLYHFNYTALGSNILKVFKNFDRASPLRNRNRLSPLKNRAATFSVSPLPYRAASSSSR